MMGVGIVLVIVRRFTKTTTGEQSESPSSENARTTGGSEFVEKTRAAWRAERAAKNLPDIPEVDHFLQSLPAFHMMPVSGRHKKSLAMFQDHLITPGQFERRIFVHLQLVFVPVEVFLKIDKAQYLPGLPVEFVLFFEGE